MDCNKEEALKAKKMAEKKMENKDFASALKIAMKAQQLDPQLENVSQMIIVCEVHCSAEKKSYGAEKDYYGILKIDPSADDLSIKKQYRKLALVLHPDKNKFAGADDAFKLIGEAQRILLDREKRSTHDSKRRAYSNPPSWIHKQPSRQSNVHHHQPQPQQHHHPWNQSSFAQNSFPGGHSSNFQPAGVPTFWTVCPYCAVRYQFYKHDVLNKVIHCQGCKKSFAAYEMNAQGGASMNQSRQPPVVTKVQLKPTQGVNRNFTSKPVPVGVNTSNNINNNSYSQGNAAANRKRKKKVESSESESEDSSESEEEEDDVIEEQSESSDNVDVKNVDKNQQTRRSSRPKRNVSYKENLPENDDVDADEDEDDDATLLNQRKKKKTSTATTSRVEEEETKEAKDTFWKEEVRKEVKEDELQTQHSDDKRGEKETKTETVNLDDDDDDDEGDDDDDKQEPEVFECPDSEFSDFDKDRKEESFSVGQIWAVYDNDDAMPRFYAYIRKVTLSPFKLQITWLKPLHENGDEEKWLEEELPVSCGKYKRGKYDKAEDLPMFSHLVTWEAIQKGVYNITPLKGEIWAVFKNWSINWYDDATKRKYEYEFVEILSDYDDKNGVRVSYLEKVKGFTCVYDRRKEAKEVVIPADEKLRLSHMVPCCRLTGEEKEGVPKGSFELDPASLPSSAFEH